MHWLTYNGLGAKFVYKIAEKYYMTRIRKFGSVPFKDKFGLKYNLYIDTRPGRTLKRCVCTDDEGVLCLIDRLASQSQSRSPICLDAGAYIGIISLYMAQKMGPNGTVYSFEPEPVNYQRFIQNINRNPFQNIHSFHVAVWDQDGQTVFSRRDPDPGRSIVEKNSAGDPGVEPVSTITIDGFLETHQIDTVDLLKMDVEGNDLRALRGAETALRSGNISYIIFEFFHEDQSLRPQLSQFGYKLFWINRDGSLIPFTEDVEREKHWGNCLAISPKITSILNLPGEESLVLEPGESAIA